MTWFRSRLDVMKLNYISQDATLAWSWTDEKIKSLLEMDLDTICAMPWAFMKLAEFTQKEYSYSACEKLCPRTSILPFFRKNRFVSENYFKTVQK